ncbi:hypothetical protein FF38_10422 [Lucilia cuprina]|uniref:Uncharacterized protein n=1 Tax=Lucilia cuprina TaxID=7375 RepID=A0A0L0BQD5_LUCCU|nr:hypothetical protein FF38_10422 [Lucilia cuprina]
MENKVVYALVRLGSTNSLPPLTDNDDDSLTCLLVIPTFRPFVYQYISTNKTICGQSHNCCLTFKSFTLWPIVMHSELISIMLRSFGSCGLREKPIGRQRNVPFAQLMNVQPTIFWLRISRMPSCPGTIPNQLDFESDVPMIVYSIEDIST